MDEQVARAIVDLLSRQGGRPRSERQIARALAGHDIEASLLREALSEMVRAREIEQTRQGAFRLPRPEGEIVGVLSVSRRGFGFVSAEGGDVYVPAQRMTGAMHGDTVQVRLLRASRFGGTSGEVVRVLSRAHATVVGRYEKHGKAGFVVPSDARITHDIVVGSHARAGALDGDMVVAKIDRHPDARHNAAGTIVEVIGHESEANIEIEVIVREHNLRVEFEPDVAAAAEAVSEEVSQADLEGRTDYRDLFTCTIDGADAKDFDDAVSVEGEGNKFVLTVHIADVANYVGLGSPLDTEAALRGTSVYLADRVLPMLPQRLSNGICSLNPQVNRLTMSVRMFVDGRGEVEHFEIVRSVIASDRRLTYEEVDEWIASGRYPDRTAQTYIELLLELSRILERRRVERGALEFETAEAKVILDETGRPRDVQVREPTPATKIIEEAMILTNEVVAGLARRHSAPMIYRIHEEPDAAALAEVGVILEEFNYPAKNLIGADPRAYQSVIRHVHNRPEKLLINTLLLRSMKQAIYSATPGAHFGLASEHYTHFTSPIRRYPDLVVHHLLGALLAWGRQAATELFEDLEQVAEHCSLAEREAEEAERESVTVKICELMAGRLGESFDGIITGVTNFGLFVALPNTVEGLVHISNMTDDYYALEADRFLLRGERTGKVYRLGQALKVRLVNVVVGERRIDLVVDSGEGPGRGRGRRRK